LATLKTHHRISERSTPSSAANVWLLWGNPDTTIERLARLLAPSGKLAITHLPRHGNPTKDDADQAAQRIEQQMQRSGLIQVERAYLPLQPAPAVCVTGRTC
jgi:hypothetical protein